MLTGRWLVSDKWPLANSIANVPLPRNPWCYPLLSIIPWANPQLCQVPTLACQPGSGLGHQAGYQGETSNQKPVGSATFSHFQLLILGCLSHSQFKPRQQSTSFQWGNQPALGLRRWRTCPFWLFFHFPLSHDLENESRWQTRCVTSLTQRLKTICR